MEKPNSCPNGGVTKKSSFKKPGFGSAGKSLSFEEDPDEPLDRPKTTHHVYYYDDPEPEVKKGARGCGWWEPDNERNLAEYCMQTSVHGLKYLGEPRRHITERIFWGFSFCLSVFVTSYLIYSVWMKYRDSPVVVTFQPYETFVEQIPFPAVTICNMNKVLKSKASQYVKAASGPANDSATQDARRNVYYLDHVCSNSNKPFSKIFNYSSTQGTVDPSILKLVSEGLQLTPEQEGVEDVAAFLQEASQTCTDMLKLCLWQGVIYNCSDLFKPIETNFGKCCTFNMVPQTLLHRYLNDSRDKMSTVKKWSEWDLSKDGFILPVGSKQKYPLRQNRAGKVSGLAFLADPALDEYFCTSSDSTGFRLATHLSTDVPHVTDFGLGIRPNSEHFISVRPEVTLADDIIKEYATEKRNCYFEGEYELKYYNYYTSWNCFDECIANMTYEQCNCVRYYMPRDDKREICGPSNYSCAEDVKRQSFLTGVKDLCQNCLPTCTEIRYTAEATSTPFRRRVDLWLDDFNVSTSWAKSNISIIHVYFGQESTYARVRGQLYGITDLIANFGGLMGLCMGFSGLSLVELLYFFSMRVWCRSRRKRWIKKEQEKEERLKKKASQFSTKNPMISQPGSHSNEKPAYSSGSEAKAPPEIFVSRC